MSIMMTLNTDHGYILVIHPDEEMRQWLTENLTACGHTVAVSDNVELGLALFRRDRHQLIIADLVFSQEQLLMVLLEEAPGTPVITVSGDVPMEVVLEALKNGAVDHFFKNRDVLVLSHTVQRALERGRLLRENREYQQQLEAANAELERSLETLQEDQEAGRRIQYRLLPPTPFKASEDCVVSHRIFPSLYLSGDFVDYFKIGDHKLGFYLADVSGHGAASAFVTVFLKAITNRIQKHYERKTSVSFVAPSKILAAINEELIATKMGKHLAMFCGVIDLENNRLTYSVAAHYPPPLLVCENVTLSLAGRGLPLGLFKEVHHEEHSVSLAQNFTLIATSDGVLEVMPKGSAADKEKQLQAMAIKVQTVDDLVSLLQLTDDDELPDDVALLVIKRAS